MIGSNGVLIVTRGMGLPVGRVLAVLALAAGGVDAGDADLDSSFSDDGRFAFSMYAAESAANAVAIQPHGKIVVAGWSYNGSD